VFVQWSIFSLMPANPYKAAILAILDANPLGLTEYDLICRLQENEEMFPLPSESPQLALFRKHFLVMNALYQLQTQLFEKGVYLAISPLDIRLSPVAEAGVAGLPDGNTVAPLREYYLDWKNFDQTGEEIEFMLRRFHERYLAIDERLDALRTLGLPADAPWATVKQAYRRLAALHHPDKGGDSARFRAVRAAYELLSRWYEN
jgi:hypothetical protein